MPDFRPLPERADLEGMFRYDPLTGLLLRRSTGKIAGCHRTRRGGRAWMVTVGIGCVAYPAHRIIWRMMTGEDPAPLTIDHIDRNPFNNAWANLRTADAALQSANREWQSTLGHKGVAWHKATGKWQARVRIGGTRVYLGLFDSIDDAQLAIAASFKSAAS